MTHPIDWTEADLLLLLGQPESARLEFKSARLFEEWATAVAKISCALSAFANSEGGTLVIGVREDREGKHRVAGAIDGVDVSSVTPERLQQAAESSISPYLSGIRLRTIRLSGQDNRAVFVIVVPQGVTAYQASDHRYYGRSEFESKALPDHEVRLRMQRGKLASMVVMLDPAVQEADLLLESWADAGEEPPEYLHEAVSDLAYSEIELLPGDFSFSFGLKIENTGEVTIRGFLLQVAFLTRHGVEVGCGNKWLGRQLPHVVRFDGGDRRLFPRDSMRWPEDVWTVVHRGINPLPERIDLAWEVFLDNAPPCRGVLDLRPLFQDRVSLRAGHGAP